MPSTSKTVLITGAASGIGKSTAELLYQKEFRVIAAGIRPENLEKAFPDFSSDRLICLKLDVSKPDDWEYVLNAGINHFGGIDILVNSAGVIEPGYVHQTSIEKINQQVDINLKGSLYGTHFLAKHMLEKGGGHIINIASLAGVAPIPGISIYSATKFGIRGFSLAAAQELEENGVIVSVICPDAVQTRMLDYQQDKKESAMVFSASRYLTPEQVARAVLKTIEKPRYEVWLPWPRGVLATLGSVFPGMAHVIKRFLIRKGLKKQSAYGK